MAYTATATEHAIAHARGYCPENVHITREVPASCLPGRSFARFCWAFFGAALFDLASICPWPWRWWLRRTYSQAVRRNGLGALRPTSRSATSRTAGLAGLAPFVGVLDPADPVIEAGIVAAGLGLFLLAAILVTLWARS